MRPDAGLKIAGHDHGRGAAEELKGVHVAAQPDILLHVEYRLEVAVPAEGGHTTNRWTLDISPVTGSTSAIVDPDQSALLALL